MEPTTAVVPQQDNMQIMPGFGSAQSFALIQRQAQLLASSALVPKEFQGNIASCVIAMEMANRMGANPLMVMQNLYIVQGKPSWSSQFLVAALNSTQRFSPLRFEVSQPEPEREVETEITEWVNKQKTTKKIREKIRNQTCTAWAIEKSTGDRLTSPPVSIEMAVKEGWYSKSGSKWQTMPELMLRYRAATFFCRLYAPEVTMGFQTAEEIGDVVDITPPVESASATDVMKRFEEQSVTDAVLPGDDGWPAPPSAEIPMTDEERAKIESEEQSLFGDREPGREG